MVHWISSSALGLNKTVKIPPLKQELQIPKQDPKHTQIPGQPRNKNLSSTANKPGLRSSLCSPSVSSLPSTMSTPVPPPQPRGIDYSLPTCGEIQCNSHGKCVVPPGGGTDLVCDCELGYQGMSCEDTVNGALSLPLTLSVLAVIIGLLIMAFIFAKLRQRQKKQHRKRLAEKHGYNVVM